MPTGEESPVADWGKSGRHRGRCDRCVSNVVRLVFEHGILDLTPYGRQEDWEDSPPGWPPASHLRLTSPFTRAISDLAASLRVALEVLDSRRRIALLLSSVTSKRVPGGVVHKLPVDLREALLANSTALAAWMDITPLARNEFICWVEDAKQEMTRKRRIRRTQEELEEGQRRPCCWPGCKHRERTGS
jgi:hypothetical protein